MGTKRFNPWVRRPATYNNDEDIAYYIKNLAKKHPKFLQRGKNRYLDAHTKRAALMVSPSVVSLVSYIGKDELNQGCGTIIEKSEEKNFFVLTSANLIRHPTQEGVDHSSLPVDLNVVVNLSSEKSFKGQIWVHDFHYNIAVIRFDSETPLKTAKLGYLDDSLSMNPSRGVLDEKSFRLLPHSSMIKLLPGDPVITVGRYFAKPFSLMTAPGEFSLKRSTYDCKELLTSSCKITRCGDGSPVINLSGEVIGVAFYDFSKTRFIPVNIVRMWWEHYKIYRELRRPVLGIEASNFYTAKLELLEKIIRDFPNIYEGVVVEKVISGTSGQSAGLCVHDVIIRFGDKEVRSFLELFEMIWNNVGHLVEVGVARVGHKSPLYLKMSIDEATPHQLNCWPQRKDFVKKKTLYF